MKILKKSILSLFLASVALESYADGYAATVINNSDVPITVNISSNSGLNCNQYTVLPAPANNSYTYAAGGLCALEGQGASGLQFGLETSANTYPYTQRICYNVQTIWSRQILTITGSSGQYSCAVQGLPGKRK